MAESALTILGAPGSPYSRKLRAVLRYRHIPHRWINRGSPESRDLPRPRIDLLPQLIFPGPDGEPAAHTDTTPLIQELEDRWPGRSVIPSDPVVAFVDALLEDYADEWLTKAMFHYRWAHAPDIDKAARILPRWFRTNAPEAELTAAGEQFAARQIERLWVVGSNETTAPIIEASYRRLLQLLDGRLTVSRFVLGERPARCDFALYGQLTQLTGFDPTPSALSLAEAPRVVAWTDVVEDLSGVDPPEPGFTGRADLGDAVGALLTEVGRVHAPSLLANAAALRDGDAEVRTRIDGAAWVQRPFPYQARCLGWLRDAHAALTPADRSAVDRLLAGTGCDRLFG